ncbi:acetyl-coenzyme A synthetase N-terminal domain-containing protein [Janibacter sp. DB-40]|uniref:acetyl-coenzyme A synthetase N-terminal domain-containing protein n=1 Tax=Janibacter sp. DB-40 TaxID=3028808 RepID=UPI002406B18E|nr:acetyl-coenzyme A synthetase N-terminal domain-containing protein [Janibacter sp. DB-40]
MPESHPAGIWQVAPPFSWEEVADLISFDTPFADLWLPGERSGRWFVGGELNLSVNCVDRHLVDRSDRSAIHWEGSRATGAR